MNDWREFLAEVKETTNTEREKPRDVEKIRNKWESIGKNDGRAQEGA